VSRGGRWRHWPDVCGAVEPPSHVVGGDVPLAQHASICCRVCGAASLYARRGARRAAAQGRGTWGRGVDRDCWRVGSPAADHTTVLVPHHESASAVAWSPPVQAGPVAARRPWLAGCARDRQVGEEQLLSGARRHVVTRPPDDVACSHRVVSPDPAWRRRIGPHRQPARSSGCCWVPRRPAGRPLALLFQDEQKIRWVCQPRVEQITCRSSNRDRDRPARPQVRHLPRTDHQTGVGRASRASCDAFQTSRCRGGRPQIPLHRHRPSPNRSAARRPATAQACSMWVLSTCT